MKTHNGIRLALKPGLLAVLAAVLALPGGHTAEATAGNTIALLGTDGYGGRYSSLVLDSSGNPVISDYHIVQGLRVFHCNDSDCLGNDETPSAPHNSGDFGRFTSLALDASGHPVVSYYDVAGQDLMLLHCNDPYCLGGDESIESPDIVGDVGKWSSLVLDAAGNPIVAYYDVSNRQLKVLHCNDPICEGEGDTITFPDTVGDTFLFASMKLDASGNPVVVYEAYEGTYELRVLHCGDPNCESGNTIESPITAGLPAGHCSLALDVSGNPVVAFYEFSDDTVKILHCNDADCTGGDESTTSPDSKRGVGRDTSVVLDSSGYPVVSYNDFSDDYLKVMHCNDANCAGGDESVLIVDAANTSGQYSSLTLDSWGNPVVSYYDGPVNGNLKLLHCSDPNCAGKPVGGMAELPAVNGSQAAGSSGLRAGVVAGIAGVVAAAVALGAAARCARRWRGA